MSQHYEVFFLLPLHSSRSPLLEAYGMFYTDTPYLAHWPQIKGELNLKRWFYYPGSLNSI